MMSPGTRQAAPEGGTRRFVRFVIPAALVLAAACESKPKSAAAPPPPPAPASVTIDAMDYAFTAPAEIPAGVTRFHLKNDGPGLHHAIFVRLDSGKTVADLLQVLDKTGKLPGWGTFVGGPNVPDPGQETVATLDLEAGNYAILCILDMPGGIPHYKRGMYRALTVTAPVAGTPKAAMPASDNQISLSDMVFKLAEPITAGTHTFRVVIAPGQPHEVLVVQLDSGKTGQDYVRWLPDLKGPAPGHAIGGTAAAAPGIVQTFTATFRPGDFLLIDLVPDVRNGKPHFLEGMMETVTVAK